MWEKPHAPRPVDWARREEQLREGRGSGGNGLRSERRPPGGALAPQAGDAWGHPTLQPLFWFLLCHSSYPHWSLPPRGGDVGRENLPQDAGERTGKFNEIILVWHLNGQAKAGLAMRITSFVQTGACSPLPTAFLLHTLQGWVDFFLNLSP